MKAQINVGRIVGLLVVVSLMLGWIAVAPVAGAELAPPLQETPAAEEPEEPEPPAEPEATQPPAEPEATQPPTEPEATQPPTEPGEPPAEPPPPSGGSSSLRTLVIVALVGVVGLTFIAIIVILLMRPRGGAEEVPAEVPSVPITTLAEDIKAGRVSKVQVSGENLTITRIDGLTLRSHKEPTADLVQLLTNLGVTSEMMANIIIEVD